jgi:hypothetical protein
LKQVGKTLKVPDDTPNCLAGISHMLILFDNDKHKEIYRMVKFKVGEGASHFVAYRIHEYIFRVRRGFGARKHMM